MQQSIALEILKTGVNVFLTGEPGSGKTYVLGEYTDYLRAHAIEPAITASTGIAATHIGGMTIHSWSGTGIKDVLTKKDLDAIKAKEYVTRRIRSTSVLIIDEISMLGPDMLDSIDAVCRVVRENTAPFGGLQVVFVGDFFQLPPIRKQTLGETEAGLFTTQGSAHLQFAFQSSAWERAGFTVCYLTEQHRQDDMDFLDLLSSLRRNTFSDAHRTLLSQRVVTEDQAPLGMLKLFSHNADIDRINVQMLETVPAEAKVFTMESHGPDALVAMLKKGCLSPEQLVLKIGAKVMCTKNNPRAGFINGTLGEVIAFDDETHWPIIHCASGVKIVIEPAEWGIEEGDRSLATITQLPLRLAWAITVHKSQGMSLDAAVMDLSGVFAYGQGYVALSRVRRLSGLHLLGWHDRAVAVDPNIMKNDVQFRNDSCRAQENHDTSTPAARMQQQEDFIRLCGGKIKEQKPKPKQKKSREKISTYEKTRRLISSAATISAIAQDREMTVETIIEHLLYLLQTRTITPSEIVHLRPAEKEFADVCAEVFPVFVSLGTEKLKPVFEVLEGKHSYETLRIARIFFDDDTSQLSL